MFHLEQKCFLKLLDLSTEDINGLLDLAADLKAQKKRVYLTVFCLAKTSP